MVSCRYHLTLFYPKTDMTLPLAATAAAIMVAQILSAPIAAVLFSLDGMLGLRGWQWLAVVEGGMTIAVGLSLLWWLPPRPESIKSLNAKELMYISSHVSRFVTSCISGIYAR
jgi:MFS transporter, ACS family, tartrate transporter